MRQWESLNKNERGIYQDAVAASHDRRLVLHILTLNGAPVYTFTDTYLGGQVEGDRSRTPSEIYTFRVLDAEGDLDWEGGEHRRYKARLFDDRYVPALGDWIRCAEFTGPLWDFEREGEMVSCVAQGSERLAMGSVRGLFQRGRKARATSVIRALLAAAGARPRLDYRIPAMKKTLPRRTTITVKRRNKKGKVVSKRQQLRASWQDTYYMEAKRIASAINRQLLADRWGRFILRRHPKTSVITLDSRHIVGPVTFSRKGRDDLHNVFVIEGPDPKGPKKPIRRQAVFHKRHPLSRESLAWHGKNHELKDIEQNKQVKTGKDAYEIATRRRNNAMRSSVSVQVSCIPVLPWLTLGERVKVVDPAGRGARVVKVDQYTKPATPGAADPMTIGVTVTEGAKRGYR